MSQHADDISATRQLADDLRLQAWLARAEVRNPSLHEHVSVLSQTRDELRLQLKLGKMEAAEEWHHVEARWQHLRPRLEHALDGAVDGLDHALDEIRAGYHRLRGDG